MQQDNRPKTLQPLKLTEGKDYHWENGRIVFTATYLLERGYCCENGCRNCPYGFKKSANSIGQPPIKP
ncbi:MAG: hypothetical protein IT258_21485 [Saprospiraceae bacterium]|nr:hypothetical protein [Saprospiraceae bacterium]